MTGDVDVVFTIHQHREVSPALDRDIRDLLAACFPHEQQHYAHDRTWRSEPAWIITGTAPSGRIAAHMAVVERVVSVGDKRMPVAVFGPQSVCVIPEMRRRGLVKRMMKEAATLAEHSGIGYGLLFARDGIRENVYAPLGWEELPARVFLDNGCGGVELRTRPSLPMALSLTGGPFPAGDIVLNGPDW